MNPRRERGRLNRVRASVVLALLLVSCGGTSSLRRGGSVAVTPDGLLVDGRPTIMASIEVPYYRFAKASDWRPALEAMKAAGMNTISFYVPWGFHEMKEGEFDFDGARSLHETRNLNAFLDLCTELGLYAVARVGPYECGEMTAGGIPEWVLRTRPGIAMMTYDSGAPVTANSAPVPSLLHPEYLKLVRHWYQGLWTNVLSRHLHSRGGPVIMVSVENELVYSGVRDAWNYDYNPAIVGEGGIWPRWLAARYGTIEEYNTLHEPDIAAWHEAPLPRVFPHEDPRITNRENSLFLLDWQYFHEHYVQEVLVRYGGMLKELGVDVPLCQNFNMPSPDMFDRMNSSLFQFHNFARTAGAGVLSTPTFWGPSSLWFWPLQRYRSVQARYAWSGPNWGFNPETPWGSNWGGYDAHIGTLTQVLWEMAHGGRGFNIYLGVDSRTSRTDTVPGISYAFWDNAWTPYPGCAPLDENMNRTRLYSTLEHLGAVMGEYGADIAGARTNPEVAVGFYPDYDREIGMDVSDSLRFWEKPHGFREQPRALKDLELLSGALIRGNAEYDVVNVRDDAEALSRYPAVILHLYDFMDRATQERLRDYVTGGGTLIAFGYPPTLDEHFRPCTVLRDEVFRRDVEKEIRGLPDGTVFRVDGFGDVATGADVTAKKARSDNPVYTFAAVDNDSIASFRGRSCGFRVTAGRGRAVLIGSHHLFAVGGPEMDRHFSREQNELQPERNFGLLDHLVAANSTAVLARSRSSARRPNAFGASPDRCEVWEHADAAGKTVVTYVLNRSVTDTRITVTGGSDTIELSLCGVGSAMIVRKDGRIAAAILNGFYDVEKIKDGLGAFGRLPGNAAPYVRIGAEEIRADRPTNLTVVKDRETGRWRALATIGCEVVACGETIRAEGLWRGRITVDGKPHDWAGRGPLAVDGEDATFNEIDMTTLYAWNDAHDLYIAFSAPLGSWNGAYGIAIASADTRVPRFTGADGRRDAWNREIVFTGGSGATHEIYIQSQENVPEFKVADYGYWDGSTWQKQTAEKAGIALAGNRPMGFAEVRIPRRLIGDPREVELAVWVTGGGLSPAYDIVPSSPGQLAVPGVTQWGGRAVVANMARYRLE